MIFSELSPEKLVIPGGYKCSCGRVHKCELAFLKIGKGVIRELPEMLRALGSEKPFLVCDCNTYEAAGREAERILQEAGIAYVTYLVPGNHPKPAEWEVGSVLMHFDPSCDLFLAVGSGVLNDICKVLSKATGVPNAVVGTAPSMDGYASDSSAMEVNNVKVSLYNHAPRGILLDTEILAKAPMRMLQAGFGDMIAKYVAMVEWRATRAINGEYYCEEIAELMRNALRKVVDAAEGIPARDPNAVGKIAEGLVLAGIAMAYAGNSRPASGLEHYFSHMWEMMALDRNQPYDLHGIQVGVGTVLTLKLYEHLKKFTPDPEKAEAHMAAFDPERWEAEVRRIFGKTAPAILEIEKKAGKNDPGKHRERLARTLAHWDEIQKAMEEELPDLSELIRKMRMIGEPVKPSELGISLRDTVDAFVGSRDLRDKFLTSSLLWDLGEMEDYAKILEEEAEQ